MRRERERERWERTKLYDFAYWSTLLRTTCYGGLRGLVIFVGWQGFTAAAIAGTATMWLLLCLTFYFVYVAFAAARGKSLGEMFARLGPVDGIAFFLAPFINELGRTDPEQYLATLFLYLLLVMIPRIAVFSIRVRRFV